VEKEGRREIGVKISGKRKSSDDEMRLPGAQIGIGNHGSC
jgi:hypothetical protein